MHCKNIGITRSICYDIVIFIHNYFAHVALIKLNIVTENYTSFQDSFCLLIALVPRASFPSRILLARSTSYRTPNTIGKTFYTEYRRKVRGVLRLLFRGRGWGRAPGGAWGDGPGTCLHNKKVHPGHSSKLKQNACCSRRISEQNQQNRELNCTLNGALLL